LTRSGVDFLFGTTWEYPARTITSSKQRVSPRLLLIALLVAVLTVPVLGVESASAQTPSSIDMTGRGLDFNNPTPTTSIGSNSAVGFSHEYKNVLTVDGTRIDARATIVDIQNLVHFSPTETALARCLDEQFRVTLFDRREELNAPLAWIYTQISVCPGGGYMEFTLDFFGTTVGDPNFATNPLTLRNLRVNFTDVDNNEFIWVYGAKSYRKTQASTVTVTPEAGRLVFTGASPDLTGNDSLTKGQVEATFEDGATQKIRLGRSRTLNTTSVTLSNFFSDFSAATENADIGLVFLDEVALTTPEEPQTDGGGDTRDNTTSAASSVTPAIHKDVNALPGDPVAGTSVLIEGQGLPAGSTYTLLLSSPANLISSGTVGRSGSFSSVLVLPSGIPPGTHTLTLSVSGPNGFSLSLITRFVVNLDGTFASLVSGVGPESASLAATGIDQVWFTRAATASLATVVLGLALVLATKGRIIWPRPRGLDTAA
jgi:hypothetical protein